MGDKPFLEMLLGEFINNLPEQVDSLRTALDKKDVKALTEQAHTLKGASANLSADRISAAALQLELIGREGNLSEGEHKLCELGDEVNRLKEYIKNNVSGLNG